MTRRTLLWLLALPALFLAAWAVSEFLEGRPNPIVVTVVPPGPATRPEPAPLRTTGSTFTVVEVARAHPLPIDREDVPVAVSPGAPPMTMQFADRTAVEAELVLLRAALDEWLAAPGRGLRIEQTWSGEESRSSVFARTQRTRVVLHARLVPTPPGDAPR